MMYNEMGCSHLGVSTFFASSHPNESCGLNGLPLTPNSIQILGEFQWLKSLQHYNICKYIDIARGKHERLMVVSEHHRQSLEAIILAGATIDCVSLAHSLLSALAYLHQRRLVVRNITTSTILLSESGTFKLSQYGLFHMTSYGQTVSFPIGCVEYLPPEVLVAGVCAEGRQEGCSGPVCDVWSTGVLLARAALGADFRPSGSSCSVRDSVLSTLKLLRSDDVLLDMIEAAAGCAVVTLRHKLQDMDPVLRDLIGLCLDPDPIRRPSVARLLEHQLFSSLSPGPTPPAVIQQFPLMMDPDLDQPPSDYSYNDGGDAAVRCHLRGRSLEEVFHLWRLAGGDIETELCSQGLIKVKPAILTMPTLLTLEGDTLGVCRDRATLFNPAVVELSLETLSRRLQDVTTSAFFPLLESQRCRPLLHSQSLCALSETARLPLVIKESDIEYQLHRITLFHRLLQAYPYNVVRLRQEATVDIPPLYRGHVWAALLAVIGLLSQRYKCIDKQTSIPADRQIEVDIPRCHQYNGLLSSPAGHRALHRVLKSWVVTHPQYVYWQGLDSLAAPLVYLNFNDEALAYACLSAFIDKYLYRFFLKDNAAVIQEYLAVFSQLIAFHHPLLAAQLHDVGFVPELYAIPWFLTMFTHVFPLHKIFHIWDALLLRDCGFPLCVGVAILSQLRDRLLQFGFNECILLFSDMPDISMEEVVRESARIRDRTPDSVLHRLHAPISGRSEPDKLSAQPSIGRAELDELSAHPISLQQLKTLRSPRISAADLKKWSQDVVPPLVIDVRPVELYTSGCFPGSVHVPTDAESADCGLDDLTSACQLAGDRLTVVVGTQHDVTLAAQVTDRLVSMGQRRVCSLHRGDAALREAQLLTSPV